MQLINCVKEAHTLKIIAPTISRLENNVRIRVNVTHQYKCYESTTSKVEEKKWMNRIHILDFGNAEHSKVTNVTNTRILHACKQQQQPSIFFRLMRMWYSSILGVVSIWHLVFVTPHESLHFFYQTLYFRCWNHIRSLCKCVYVCQVLL